MPALSSASGKTALPLLLILAFAVIFGSLAAPATALAHNVNVFAYAEGDEVITESYFNDGRKCRDSTIEVFDGRGNKLAEGKTDEKGLFSFRPSARTDLVIRLTASMGHRSEYTVPAQDLLGDLPENLLPEPETHGTHAGTLETAADHAHGQAQPEAAQSIPTDSHDLEHYGSSEIERIVDRAVSQRLAPIRRALEETRRKRRLSDIIGGIGYIVGLMGLIMYFRSRQKQGR